jgi:uncharacterized protein YjbI with pentapeptide repeats
MANEEHLAILRQGVDAWNEWREENPDVRPDLREANLGKVNLFGVNLEKADLFKANLIGADLIAVNLRSATLLLANLEDALLDGADMRFTHLGGANLEGALLQSAQLDWASLELANLKDAGLNGATLIGTNLRRANFGEAQLLGVNLTQADLTGAHLNSVSVGGTVFSDLDLSTVQGLDSVRHDRPSEISVSTLVKSRGKIPESFLRGCGVPDSLIEYLPSLLGAMKPIEFYSCFISYSTKDEDFAKRLHGRMREHNLRVWFANEDLKGGHKLHQQIDEAIRVYDKFIIVLSPESLRSKWVMNEVRRTRKAELANNQRKFFPIALLPYNELKDWECIDPETGTDLAAEIREYYIPDFRNWKNHDSFEKAFAQLLEGLKAVDATPAPRIEPKGSTMPDPNESRRRHLRILEDQQARMGVLTPPHIVMEIEDLRKEVEKLDDSQQP